METLTPAAKFTEAITNHSPFEPLYLILKSQTY